MFCKARWSRSLLALALATAALAAGTVQAQTLLRWKFKPGQTLNYEIHQDSTGNIAGRPVDQTAKITMDMTWKVKSVDGEGNATLTVTIVRVRMKCDQPTKDMSFEYDSASKESPKGWPCSWHPASSRCSSSRSP